MTVYTNPPQHFQQYQQVLIYDNTNTLVFSGYITTPKEQKPGFQNSLIHTITCIDQHWLADKRRVVASYSNKTVGFIAQDLLNNILSQEGVTVGIIYDGPTPSTTLYPSLTLYPGGNVGLVPAANFVYCTVGEALDALVKAASSSGVPYYWMIDQFKKLYVVPYTTIVGATVDGTTIDQAHNPPSVTRANPTYRNTQYIAGGTAETVTQTETRKGDGNTTAFTMGFAFAHVPTVTVNGVSKTVGIKGVESGKDWYWNQGDPTLTQDSSGTKLTSSDTLQVVYIGQYDSIVITNNSAQVTYQASIDGTSGIIEDIQTDATLTNVSDALTEASNLLNRYAMQGILFTFQTRDSSFAPGQLITLNYAPHSFYNTQALIENVTASDGVDGLNIWYQVTAVVGPYDQTWQSFFSKALAKTVLADVINVGVSQTVTILQSFSATNTPTATLTVNAYSCPLPSTTLFPSTTLYGC
jgi:hypothetical protein